jgi:hypothetical protein
MSPMHDNKQEQRIKNMLIFVFFCVCVKDSLMSSNFIHELNHEYRSPRVVDIELVFLEYSLTPSLYIFLGGLQKTKMTF